jgi:hypothetical protein
MYVLCLWADTVVLCKGAVLPYHEFVHGRRLTDDDWKATLDSSQSPAVPVRLAPVMTGEGLSGASSH